MKLSASLLFLFFLLNKNIFAGGLDYNTTFGTRTFSLNGLYFAGSPGLSSVSSNPAGLIMLKGIALEINLMDRVEENVFDSPAEGLHKSFKDDNISAGAGFYWNISEDVTIGAAYSPVIDYKPDWPFALLRTTDSTSTILPFNMFNKFEMNSISPAAAFRIGSLSIGIAANIYRIINQIEYPLNNTQDTGLAAYQMKLDLDSWAFGGTLGILYDINDDLRAGLNLVSGFKADLKGTAESVIYHDIQSAPSIVNASTKLEFPWKFGLGLLYKLNQYFNFNIDGAYSLWGNGDKKLNFIFDDPLWRSSSTEINNITGFAPNSLPLNFNNCLDAGIGAEYFSGSGIILRAGYRFSQSPNSVSTYNYLFPSVDHHFITIGIGYSEENLTFDAGIAYTFGPATEISPSDNSYLSGLYSNNGYIPSINIRYEFK